MTSSVGTQTEWSWLKDWEEIFGFSRDLGVKLSGVKSVPKTPAAVDGCGLHCPASGSDDSGGYAEQSLTAHDEALIQGNTNDIHEGVAISSGNINEDNKNVNHVENRSESDSDRDKRMKSMHKTKEDELVECTQDEPLVLPAIVNAGTEKGKLVTKDTEDFTLPPIVSVSEKVKEDHEEDDASKLLESNNVGVSSLEQLEQLTFPILEAQHAQQSVINDPVKLKEQSSNDSEEEEEEEQGEGHDQEGKGTSQISINGTGSVPSLKLDNLPWPKILRYVRESESLASEYFSSHNKEAVEARITRTKALLQQPKSVSSKGDGLDDHHPRKEERELNSLSESSMDSGEKERGSELTEEGHICDFCGHKSSEISLLRLTEDKELDMDMCCEGKKEFCALMAVCMKQMIRQLQQQKPKRISVQLTKNIVEKTAKERALALMRRQRKWEELRKNKEAIEQQGSMKSSKHTQVIQFSLLSSGTTEGGWIVRPGSSTQYQTPKRSQIALRKKREAKKKEEDLLKKGVLLPKTIERLKQYDISRSELEVLKYSDGSKFSVALPDGTRHLYYHSGNLAAISFSPYCGVLAHIFFEDSSQQSILAYADELSRLTCYNNDGNIRLLLRQSEGFLFDGESVQSCKKRWRWSEEETPELQPFTISLNKQLSVKILSHKRFLFVFSGSKQNHVKFDVESKLNDEDVLITRDKEKDILAQNHLMLVKNRISQLLQLLKQTSRSTMVARKHSITEGSTTQPGPGWQSIYSSKTRLKGDTLLHARRGRRSFTGRHRTRSTGEITLQKSPLKLKPLT